ncbi:MAG: glycosyltransferase family 2 protein [Firmicutes bacterium]|nr:glycosyltransferase family 2 protein [Bacillota bacterium]
MMSIIIPNYNGEKFLKECLESLLKQTIRTLEVIIVDNASSDNSINIIDNYKNLLNISLVKNNQNLGFAKAVNIGIKRSKKKYVFLLNNDVVLKPNTLERLYNCILKDDSIFSVQTKMLQYYKHNSIDDAGDGYTILGWAYQIGNNRSSKLYKEEREIFSACAGATLYRKSFLDNISLFDENFFAYMEDVDIGYRARIHGYKNIYCPQSICYHVGSATSGSKYNEFKIRLAARNNIYVLYKNMPIMQLFINLPFLIIGFIIKGVFFYLKGFGQVYIKGIYEGVKTLDKVNKVKYSNKNLVEYIKIEWLLLKNTFTYIVSKLRMD